MAEDRRKGIEKAIAKVSVKALNDYYNMFIDAIRSNPDFVFTDIMYKKEDGSKKYKNTKIDSSWEKCIDKKVVQEMNRHIRNYERKMKKADLVKAMTDILMIDPFVETIAYSCVDDRLYLLPIIKELGVEDCFNRIWEDPVYQKRENYLKKIRKAAHAAVNLYGVISLDDFLALLGHYEGDLFADMEGYERTGAFYDKTICFKPCDSIITLYNTMSFLEIGIDKEWFATTADNMLVHPVFYSAVEIENDLFMKNGFYDEDEEETHRVLIQNIYESDKKKCKRYLPDKETFYKYCDMEANEMFNLAEKNFLRYLRTEYSESERLKFMSDSSIIAYAKATLGNWDGSDEEFRLFDFYNAFSDACVEMEIFYESASEFRDLLELLLTIYKTSRLWSFRGLTKKEAKGPDLKKAYIDKLMDFYDLDDRMGFFGNDDWDDDMDDDMDFGDLDLADIDSEQLLGALTELLGGMFSDDDILFGSPMGKNNKKNGPLEIPGQLTFDFGDDDE